MITTGAEPGKALTEALIKAGGAVWLKETVQHSKTGEALGRKVHETYNSQMADQVCAYYRGKSE